MGISIKTLVDELLDHFGPQQWWPSDSPFETMLGAILTQNTAWKNVEIALNNLKAAGLLHPEALLKCPVPKLEELIRPAGYFRQKAKKIKIFLDWFVVENNADLDRLKKADSQTLREEVLSLWGIGPETADAILCYAIDHPVFVNDAYTMRVLSRHQLIGEKAKYQDVQELAALHLPEDNVYLKDAHALFVMVGKMHCHKKKPDCSGCPLQKHLISDQ